MNLNPFANPLQDPLKSPDKGKNPSSKEALIDRSKKGGGLGRSAAKDCL